MPSALRLSSFIRLTGSAALLAIVAAACVGGSTISATDPWVRYTGPDVAAGGFMTLTNGGDQDDALVSATSPDFATIELHETSMADDGMMAMQPVSSITVPAGGTTALEPGSFHLMLFDPTGTIEVGQTVSIQLTFEGGETVTVEAEVQAP